MPLKKSFVVFSLFISCLFLIPSFLSAVEVFNLGQLPTSLEQAQGRLAQWKNTGQLEWTLRPPAALVLVSPQLWRKFSGLEKAGLIRDCLYFVRSKSAAPATENHAIILFNQKNPLEEFGWGNVHPGDIIIFKP